MHHKLTKPLALALSIAFAAAAPPIAHAQEGFGYDDPRSMQIHPSSMDATPDGGFVYIDNNRVWKYSPSSGLSLVAGGGTKAAGMKPIAATSAYLATPGRVAAADDGSLKAGGETDCVIGGGGHDHLIADGGADVVSGGAGGDVIYGDNGDDRIKGGSGRDWISGGLGDDYIHSRGKADPDMVKCGPGEDKVAADSLDRVAPNCEHIIFHDPQ